MLKAVGVAALSGLLNVFLAIAVSQAQPVLQLDLPAQSLAASLRELGSHASTNVLFDPPLVEGFDAPAITARLTLDQAFASLLVGTGLMHRFLDDRTVMVVPAPAAARRVEPRSPASRAGGVRLVQVDAESPAPATPGSSPASSGRSASVQGSGEDFTQRPWLQEVVVSATKRGEQRLQSTPLTVTAFSSKMLSDSRIENLSDLAAFTAGLDLQKVAPGQTQVIIRGVTLGSVISGQPQTRATTGLYVNDVSFEQNGMNPDLDLFDLERVEVLKGPQGTLFGSSAMAGAIRYVTKSPDLDAISARVLTDASSIAHGSDSYSAKGVVNFPVIAETLGLRVMAYRNDNGGWIDNAFSGRADVNTDRQSGARVAALWRASADFSAHLMVQHQDMDVGHVPTAQQGDSAYYGKGPASPAALTTFVDGEASWRDELLLATLEMNWELGNATLTALSGFVDRKFRNSRPGDLREFMHLFYAVDLPNPEFVDPYTSSKFSEEIRIATEFGARAGFTGGVYYSDGDIAYSSIMREQGWDRYVNDVIQRDPVSMGCLPGAPDAIFCGTQRNSERQLSVYGEFDLHASQNVTLTLGGRWFQYDQEFDEQYAGFFNGGPTDKTQQFTESGFNPKVGVSYEPDARVLLFASAAKGFRMGGVDDPIPDLCVAELNGLGLSNYDGVFESDSLWTYELGAKSTLLDKRVTLNGAVFQTEWDDIQTGTTLQCGYRVTQNATKQRIRGLEISTRWGVARGFGVELNGSYTDSRLVGDALPIRGRDGDRAPLTPRIAVNGTLDYQHPIATGVEGFALLSFSYKTSSFTDYQRSIEIPAQSFANLRLGVRTERCKATLFVNNVTDKLILTYANEGHGGELDWFTARPRTVGMELRVDF